jgi:hypothetical protein
MYFCPKCHFSFDIGKASNVAGEEKNVIKKVADIFKKLENKEDLSIYKSDIKIDEIIKNSKYKKLTDEEKNNIQKLYEEEITSCIEFKCINCNYSLEIKESILLYELDMNDKNDKIKTIDENKLICKNPILPRTHDYICKNDSCETNNKNNKINKEAVFYRENKSMKVNYICCICNYSW